MFAAPDRKVMIGRVKRNERRDTKMQGSGKPDRQKELELRGVFCHFSPSLRASSLERSSTWVVLSLSLSHTLSGFLLFKTSLRAREPPTGTSFHCQHHHLEMSEGKQVDRENKQRRFDLRKDSWKAWIYEFILMISRFGFSWLVLV